MSHVLTLLLPVLLLGLPAATGAEKPQEPQQKDAAGQVDVRLSEYAVEMPHEVPSGATLFLVHNDGRKNHSFKIEGPGVDTMLETVVKPHETGSLEVTLQPGEYRVYCPIGSHAAKGMTMALAVRAKQP
jgi:uncharacterized cupredoxin-like copper-binding protein